MEKGQNAISSERYPVYSHFGVGFRQICWSHLVRDFLAASEEKNETGEIGKRLFKTGIQILRICKRIREETLSRSDLSKTTLVGIRNGFGWIWSWPERIPNASWESWRKNYWIVLNRYGNLTKSRGLNR